MKKKHRLTQVILLLLSGVSLASIIIIAILWITYEKRETAQESLKMKVDFQTEWEELVNSEVTRIAGRVAEDTETNELNFLEDLKRKSYELWETLDSMDRELGEKLTQAEYQDALASFLGSVNSARGTERYVVLRLADGKVLSGPQPNLEDYESYRELLASVSAIGEGFYHFDFKEYSSIGAGDFKEEKTVPKAPEEELGSNDAALEGESPGPLDEGSSAQMARGSGQSITYLKTFEPLGWVLGVTMLTETITAQEEEKVLAWLESVTVPNGMNFVVLSYEGDILLHSDREPHNNVFSDFSDLNFTKAAALMVKGAREQGWDYHNFILKDSETGDPTLAMVFYRAVATKPWLVAGWVEMDRLNAALREKQAVLDANVNRTIWRVAIISLSMLLIILFISRLLAAKASQSFSSFFEFFESASSTSVLLNPNQQPFKEFALLAEAANRMIEARARTEELLRENEAKFRTIFEFSPQAVMVLDSDFTLKEANLNFTRITGLKLSQVTGKSIVPILNIDEAAFRESQKGEKPSPYAKELKFIRADGSKVFILFMGTFLCLGAKEYILAILVDISEHKAAEKEKRQLIEKLGRAQSMETLGLMASEVAHELNNILSGIIGYPELLLREGDLNPAQKASVAEILDSGKRAAAVVDDLLTLARGVATQKVPLDLNEIVTSLGVLGSGDTGVKVTTHLADEKLWVSGSPIHLKKSVENLVANAIHASEMNETGGQVTIVSGRVNLSSPVPGFDNMEKGPYVFLEVKDNGYGIAKDDAEHIFEPFYSGKLWGGRGLGLTVASNTVRELGGGMEFNTSKEGTTFKLYLPAIENVEKPKKKQKKDLSRYRGHGETILVVDDVDIQRKLAMKMMTTLGYTPVAASSGEEALEFLQNNDADLLILDMIMRPGINGRETYERILEFKPLQKAIIASGMADGEEVDKARRLGATHFVHKPYTIETIAEAIYQALNEPNRAQESGLS
ncbi:MAG: cache domain-containing protein [Deltaproteobacteria bacterium]|jgi:PAS domain S-box-containing protein|nr:cache domain-containing protein [Deltaproteobacteria bacterium]